METLGTKLPPAQSKLLSHTVQKLTQSELESALNDIAGSKLTVKELASLRSLSLKRINSGESPFTWSSHQFNTDDVNDQDPNTCSCF